MSTQQNMVDQDHSGKWKVLPFQLTLGRGLAGSLEQTWGAPAGIFWIGMASCLTDPESPKSRHRQDKKVKIV